MVALLTPCIAVPSAKADCMVANWAKPAPTDRASTNVTCRGEQTASEHDTARRGDTWQSKSRMRTHEEDGKALRGQGHASHVHGIDAYSHDLRLALVERVRLLILCAVLAVRALRELGVVLKVLHRQVTFSLHQQCQPSESCRGSCALKRWCTLVQVQSA